MPQSLNRIPAGLLSLLQIKSLGRNPSALSDFVQPTLEMSESYFTTLSLRFARASTAGVASADQGTRISLIEVPENEIWIVRAVTSECAVTTTGVGEYMLTAPALGNIQTPTDAFALTDLTTNSASNSIVRQAGSGDTSTAIFARPWYIEGGSTFYSSIGITVTAGATLRCTVSTKVLYYKLEK